MNDELGSLNMMQHILNEQDRVIARMLQETCRVTKASMEELDPNSPEYREVMVGFYEVIKLCDRYYERIGIMLNDNLQAIANSRTTLTSMIVSMSELVGTPEEWTEGMENVMKLERPTHLKVVDDQ